MNATNTGAASISVTQARFGVATYEIVPETLVLHPTCHGQTGAVGKGRRRYRAIGRQLNVTRASRPCFRQDHGRDTQPVTRNHYSQIQIYFRPERCFTD
jgi:hypothetical protein